MTLLLLTVAITVGVPKDGSILYLQYSNTIVERYTGSPISHVGIIFHVEREPWVFEATPSRVRRVPLDEYCHEIGDLNRRRRQPMRMWIRQPRTAYSQRDVSAMRRYVESQVGRRYSVKGYVRGKRGDGIHCAQLVATTLAKSSRFSFADTHRVSPDRVVQSVVGIYGAPRPLKAEPTPSPPSWCSRSWHSWKATCKWWGWATGEAWRFCW